MKEVHGAMHMKQPAQPDRATWVETELRPKQRLEQCTRNGYSNAIVRGRIGGASERRGNLDYPIKSSVSLP
eukprot:2527940-Pleurochrysis_carterae.AAC.1